MTENQPEFNPQKVAFIGAFLPRPAVLSSVNSALLNAFASEFCDCECLGLAISDGKNAYPYPSRVRFEISSNSPANYQAAAAFVNLNGVDLVCLQVGPDLSEIDIHSFAAFFDAVRSPVISMLAEVPVSAEAPARQVIETIARYSTFLLVKENQARWRLTEGYSIPEAKVGIVTLPVGSLLPRADDPQWRVLAVEYMAGFRRVREQAIHQSMVQPLAGSIPVTGGSAAQPGMEGGAGLLTTLPPLKLDHYLLMTDGTGILKSSVFSLPDFRQGYSTADNARALIFSLLLEEAGDGPFIPIEMRASRHLAFLWNAFNEGNRRFRESLSYARVWQDEQGSEETHAVAVWALGMTLGRSQHEGLLAVARQLFEEALPAVPQFSSLRAWALALLGISAYLERFTGDRSVRRIGRILQDRLVRLYQEAERSEWPWFEETLSSGSACVPQSLIASAAWTGQTRAVEIGLEALDWLAGWQFSAAGRFSPLGDQGYMRRGGMPARFAQRPAETRAMISACLAAYRVRKEVRWLQYAQTAFSWFLGANDLGASLYDQESGRCSDGLLAGRVEGNCSAESLLAFLLAQLEMRQVVLLNQQYAAPRTELPLLQIGPPGPVQNP